MKYILYIIAIWVGLLTIIIYTGVSVFCNVGLFKSDNTYVYKTSGMTETQKDLLNEYLSNQSTPISLQYTYDNSLYFIDDKQNGNELRTITEIENPSRFALVKTEVTKTSQLYCIGSLLFVLSCVGCITIGIISTYHFIEKYDDYKSHLAYEATIKKLQQLNVQFSKVDNLKQNIDLPKLYQPQIITELTLPNDITGIVATRLWHMNTDNSLHSISIGYSYINSVIISDVIPSDTNKSGFYANKLGYGSDSITFLNTPLSSYIFGLVEMSGKFIEHTDGIIRAERMRMLLLISNVSLKDRQDISSIYGVPILQLNYEQYMNWLYSNDGIKWLQHNNKVLNTYKKVKVIDEAENILKEKMNNGN